MAGGAVGTLVHQIAPFPTGAPGAYALVGMGTLFAGIIRAPMTSVFMIFEITQDYQILVPLMVANTLSFVISRRYQPTPVYHALLRQDGIHLPTAATKTGVALRTARDVMHADVTFLPPDLSVEQSSQWSAAHPALVYLIGSPHRMDGAITRKRIDELLEAGHADDLLAAHLDESFVHAHPDHTIDIVLDRLSQAGGVLPVVSRADARRVEGAITPESLIRNRASLRSK